MKPQTFELCEHAKLSKPRLEVDLATEVRFRVTKQQPQGLRAHEALTIAFLALRKKKIKLLFLPHNKEVTLFGDTLELLWSVLEGHFGPFEHMAFIYLLTSLR